jgi:hypothetical protein
MVLALLGAGLYAGGRWLVWAANEIAAAQRREEALRERAGRRVERDLGALEFDPQSGVYRPAKRS